MTRIRFLFTIYITKLIIFVLRKANYGGTNLPGKIALKLYPSVLKESSKGYKTIFVTGTNGKTTTTKMIVSMIKSNGYDVITNDAGANMRTGITTTFIKNYKKRDKETFAVIEIDEANLKLVSNEVKISYLLITNIFRDQLDRYGEVYQTLEKIIAGVYDKETVLILNGDEPLFGNIDKDNKKVFFGFDIINDDEVDVNVEGKFCIKCGKPYSYNFLSYSHLGDYFCPNCDYKRPEIEYKATDIQQNKDGTSKFLYNNTSITIKMSGLYNVYNAISAICMSEVLQFDINKSVLSLENEHSPFGRQEEVVIGEKRLKLMLVKNPAGFNEALNTLNSVGNNVCASFILNDNFADGTDVSWIYDVNFEKVSGLIDKTFVGGTRSFDMAIRVNVSGVDKEKITVFSSYNQFIDIVSKIEEDTIYTFLTYTAMMEFRKILFDKKYISKLY